MHGIQVDPGTSQFLVVTRWQQFVGSLANKQASASFFVSRAFFLSL